MTGSGVLRRNNSLSGAVLGLVLNAAPALAQSSDTVHPTSDMQRLSTELRRQWAQRLASGSISGNVIEPSISSGKILTPHVDVARAPGIPALQVVLQSGSVGAAMVEAQFASPVSGAFVSIPTVAIPPYPPEPASETVRLQDGFPFGSGAASLYVAPGVWHLQDMVVLSNDGQFVTYGAAQLASLFPSLTVDVANSSGTPDVAAPTIGHGRILTPIVSAGSPSPYVAARLTVADNLSGVSAASVTIGGPAGSHATFSLQTSLSFPVRKGQVDAYALLPSDAAPGTYTIIRVLALDVAGNTLTLDSPADINAVFGTVTFTVTD